MDDDYLTPTWPAISGNDGTLLTEVAPLTGNVWIWAAPDDAPPSASTAILALGQNVLVSAYRSDSDPPIDKTTNPLGQYSVNVPTKTGTLVADLVSPDFSVFSAALDSGTLNADCDGDGVADGSLYRVTQTWDTDVSLEYDFTLAGNDMDAKTASGNAYLHVNGAIDWVRSVLPSWNPEIPNGNQPNLTAITNVPKHCYPPPIGGCVYLNCNAKYSPGTNRILTGAGGDCGNGQTATNTASSTILRHEFGHLFVRTHSILTNPAACNENDYYGFDEGVSDAFAALSLGTSCIGEGFLSAGCLRDLDNETQYPVNGTDSHAKGKPIAAAFWHLREDIIAANPTNGARDTKALFLLALQNNTACWDSIRSDLVEVDSSFFSGQYSALINAALNRHNIP
ncbi:MAG: hypothetical protein Q9Q13_07395 [Acidobacteriota bacterium]|nr:hypothetical protein [Acidobacteriota bacterium]